MTTNNKYRLALGITFVVIVASVLAARSTVGPVGQTGKLPAFELTAVADARQLLTAESLRERPALLNAWASWCLGCRTEHELLMELAESGRIAIYGINYLDMREDAARWLDYFGDPFELSIYDTEGVLGRDLGIEVLPTTILLESDGRVIFRHVGPIDRKILEGEIWPRLAKETVK